MGAALYALLDAIYGGLEDWEEEIREIGTRATVKEAFEFDTAAQKEAIPIFTITCKLSKDDAMGYTCVMRAITACFLARTFTHSIKLRESLDENLDLDLVTDNEIKIKQRMDLLTEGQLLVTYADVISKCYCYTKADP